MVSGFDVAVTVVDTDNDFVFVTFYNKIPPENSETALKKWEQFSNNKVCYFWHKNNTYQKQSVGAIQSQCLCLCVLGIFFRFCQCVF